MSPLCLFPLIRFPWLSLSNVHLFTSTSTGGPASSLPQSCSVDGFSKHITALLAFLLNLTLDPWNLIFVQHKLNRWLLCLKTFVIRIDPCPSLHFHASTFLISLFFVSMQLIEFPSTYILAFVPLCPSKCFPLSVKDLCLLLILTHTKSLKIHLNITSLTKFQCLELFFQPYYSCVDVPNNYLLNRITGFVRRVI